MRTKNNNNKLKNSGKVLKTPKKMHYNYKIKMNNLSIYKKPEKPNNNQ